MMYSHRWQEKIKISNCFSSSFQEVRRVRTKITGTTEDINGSTGKFLCNDGSLMFMNI
jgi:hypothetical protein